MISYHTKTGVHYTDTPYHIPWKKLHRLNGPAVIWDDYSAYYINGKIISREEIKTWIKDNNINLKKKKHQMLFMLKFG